MTATITDYEEKALNASFARNPVLSLSSSSRSSSARFVTKIGTKMKSSAIFRAGWSAGIGRGFAMLDVRAWSGLAVLLLALRSLNAGELVTNGGFEQGGAGDPWIPAGWRNGSAWTTKP